MVPQPSAAGAEVVFDMTSAALPALGAALPASGARWGAQGKSRKGGRAANAPAPTPAATGGQIQQLKEMGFSEKQAREALAECVWDVNKALDLLFTRGVPMNGEDGDAGADSTDNGSASTTSADVSDGKGIVDSSSRAEAPEARSPEASGKARQPAEGAASSVNSPGSADSTEQSTTASAASSPRSAGCIIDKSSGYSAGASAPLSPQSPIVASAEETVKEAESTEPAVAAEVVAEAVAPDTEDVCAKAVDAEPVIEDTSSALKPLTRVTRAWEMDASGSQLCVKEGDFVCVWHSSRTEHGWIYVEDPVHSEKQGWLPDNVLEELPSNQRWMRAIQHMQAAHETQLSVSEGVVYKVNIDTRTTEGWIYAETASEGEGSQAGWVPAFCFEGADVIEQAVSYQ